MSGFHLIGDGNYPLFPSFIKAELESLNRSYGERLQKPGSRSAREPRGLSDDIVIGNDVVMYCFAGAENLAFPGEWDANGSRMGRVLVHELGHAVFAIALTAQEGNSLKAVFKDHAQRVKTISYKDGDENEGFAIVSERWFGVNQLGLNKPGPIGPDKSWNADWVNFFTKIYGPIRDIRQADPSLNAETK